RLLLANVTSLITYMDVNVKRQAYAYRMLVMKSTVAVYINYKWHKFCLVNSQLAGAHTVTILGIVVVFTLLYSSSPRNILIFLFIFVLNWPDALRQFLQRPAPAGERTPDS